VLDALLRSPAIRRAACAAWQVLCSTWWWTVLYLHRTPYAPGREHGVHPLDAALGIAWPLDGLADGPTLSPKDAAAFTLDDALRSGALPTYDECARLAKEYWSVPSEKSDGFWPYPRSLFLAGE
jgi:hypothetical protein